MKYSLPGNFRPGQRKKPGFFVLGLKQEGNLFRPQGSIGYFSDLGGEGKIAAKRRKIFSSVLKFWVTKHSQEIFWFVRQEGHFLGLEKNIQESYASRIGAGCRSRRRSLNRQVFNL